MAVDAVSCVQRQKPGSNLLVDCINIWTMSKRGCSLSDVPEQIVSKLRERGLHATVQRVAVMRAVAGHPHSTADDVMDVVRQELGTISRQAVYDALGALVEVGLLRRIQPAGSAARYEDRADDNHHHLICRGCGETNDIDCAVGAMPCLTPSDDFGYAIDEAEVIYWGLCPACRTTR